MKQNAIKNVFAIILYLAIIAGLLFLFVHVALPAVIVDMDSLVAKERVSHDEKLDCIIQDFTTVLYLENVETNIKDNEINIVIYGEFCDLKATLNENMEVTMLNQEDKTSDKNVGPIFAMIGIVLACALLVWAIVYNFTCIVKVSRHNKNIKKQLKKEKTDTKVEVIV